MRLHKGLEGAASHYYPASPSKGFPRLTVKQDSARMGKHLHPGTRRKGEGGEPKAKKTNGERKVRHASRVEALKAISKVKGGRLLDDDRVWMDW